MKRAKMIFDFDHIDGNIDKKSINWNRIPTPILSWKTLAIQESIQIFQTIEFSV